ncbi:hypothetical protein, partial [Pseudomonas syringae group genomosp. 7]|uniref:hypothetical protein n=1 Tax=Pseudomonas syringae group genomosp. 7 TaxID=251699 RepID=UPI0037703248
MFGGVGFLCCFRGGGGCFFGLGCCLLGLWLFFWAVGGIWDLWGVVVGGVVVLSVLGVVLCVGVLFVFGGCGMWEVVRAAGGRGGGGGGPPAPLLPALPPAPRAAPPGEVLGPPLANTSPPLRAAAVFQPDREHW